MNSHRYLLQVTLEIFADASRLIVEGRFFKPVLQSHFCIRYNRPYQGASEVFQ